MEDLTSGSLVRKILLFSLPLVMSNLLQVLFNMADIAVVGQFAGSGALGSVGSTTQLVGMFTGFLIGVSGGINILVALYYGARDKKAIAEIVHTALLVSIGLGCFILVLGGGSASLVLRLLNTKDELLAGAVLYVRIYALGMPALAIYNFGNAVFCAVGNTKKPLQYLTLSGIVNVILNLVFVVGLHIDVAGVAIASVISQYLSAFLVVRALFQSEGDFALRWSELHLNRRKAIDILKLGIPAGFQNAVFQIANLFIQSGVNSFSAIMVAGNSAASNADTLVYNVMAAFYTACGSFMGQNYGAKKKDRILKSYFVSMVYSFGIGMLLGVTLVVFGEGFLGLFTREPEVIEAGMHKLKIMGFSYGFSAFMDNTIAANRALGKTVIPTIAVILGSCVFRIIWVNTVFAHFHTIPSLYLLYIFSWAITAVVEILYFVKIYREKMKELEI